MTNLTVLRRQKGFTQATLAHALGIPRQEVNRLENGWIQKVRPGVETRLQKLFGPQWSLATLLKDPEPRPEG
jgi:DNA-binding XRE family transcriptional regulator